MAVLYLTQFFPLPADSGGKFKTWSTIKALARIQKIDLVCFSDKEPERKEMERLKKICRRIEVVVFPQTTASHDQIRPLLWKSLFSLNPFYVTRFESRQMKEKLRLLLAGHCYRAVHVDHLEMAINLPQKAPGQFWVLEEHNLDSEICWQIAKGERWNRFKLFSIWEAIKMSWFEKRYWPLFDRIFAISRADFKKLAEKGIPRNRISVLPLEVRFRCRRLKLTDEKNVLFIGTLDWWPNRQGMIWFCQSVWPKIVKTFPSAVLMVIGRGGGGRLLEVMRNTKNLVYIGYRRRLEKYWRSAAVFIVPLLGGSGIRIKILTALAYGLPVVCTRKAAEGLPVARKILIIRDNPAGFARAVGKFLKKGGKPGKIYCSRVKKWLERNFSRQAVTRALGGVYKSSP